MPSILDILQRTPWWAFGLLAVLVVFGVQALKDRCLPVWRFLVIPAVFIGWGIVSLMFHFGSSSFLIVDWAVSALIGAAVGLLTSRTDQFHFERPGAVFVKGSALPLMRNLVIFAAKYGLTAAATIHPTQRAILVPWDIAVSGLAAGYFIGWLIHLMRAYRRPRA
jgi:hypothetical protein